MSALKSSLLCLLTTHDTAGSRQISSAKMKEHRKMSRLVSRSQAKQRIVKLVAAMCMDTPLIRSLGNGNGFSRRSRGYDQAD